VRGGEMRRKCILKGCWNYFNRVDNRRSTRPPTVSFGVFPPSRILPSAPSLVILQRRTCTCLQALRHVSPHPIRKNEDFFRIFHPDFMDPQGEISRWTKTVEDTKPPELQQPTENAVGPMPTPDPVIKRLVSRPKQDGLDPAKSSSPSASGPIGSDRSLEPTTERTFVSK